MDGLLTERGRGGSPRSARPAAALLAVLSRAAVASLTGVIWLYQRTLSPALAVAAPSCGCRFAPTCSHYAQDALRTHGVVRGLGLALRRLVKCGPWHPGGLDPVPPARFSCTPVTRAAASTRDRSASRLTSSVSLS